MRWLACAWLLLVGCFNPPTGPSYKIELLSADPPIVSVHGGDWVTIHYEGELPLNVGVSIDGIVSPPISINSDDHMFTMSAPNHDKGAAIVALYDTDRGRQIAYNADLLAYDAVPARPVWNLSPSAQQNLDWPLHPELSHPCARGGDIYLENLGDEPLGVTSVRSSNPDFAITASPCNSLEYGDYCVLLVCFTSTTQGFAAATLTATTNAGDVTVNVGATVTPPLSGLDPAFHGGGVVFDIAQDTSSGDGVVGPGGNGIVTSSRSRVIALDSTGVETARDLVPQIGSVQGDWVQTVRTTTSGIYALVTSSSQFAVATIVHLDDTLVEVGQTDLPFEAANPYFDMQVTSGGRLLAIGQYGVVAMAGGALDTTYGSNGRTAFPSSYQNRSVVDSQGRLYVAVGNGILRLTANGAIDGSFSYNLSPSAMTIDAADHVYVQTGLRVVQLSQTGAETAVVPNAPFGYKIAVDASGRVYSVSGAGVVERFSAGTSQGTFGYGNAQSVICPPSGGCYLLGVDSQTTVPFSSGPSYLDKYVLRLAD